MQAQAPQGMSISDILKIAQMARDNKQTGTNTPVEQNAMPEVTYNYGEGSPVDKGMNVPVPPQKPDFDRQGSGNSLSGILDTLKNSTLGGWIVNKFGG